MPRQLASGTELKFVRSTDTGTVHIVVDEPERGAGKAPVVSIAAGLAAWAGGALPVMTLCGRPTQPTVTGRHDWTDEFADDDLCRGCYRALPPDDRWRAFEHPQPTTT